MKFVAGQLRHDGRRCGYGLHGRLALHGFIVRDGWVRWRRIRWICRLRRIRRRLRHQPVLPADDAAAADDAAHAAGIRAAATAIREQCSLSSFALSLGSQNIK